MLTEIVFLLSSPDQHVLATLNATTGNVANILSQLPRTRSKFTDTTAQPIITPGAKILRQTILKDTLPWIVITLFDNSAL